MQYVRPKEFDITVRRPQVLLVGNGLNRCAGDDTTWDNAILHLAKDDAILDKIKRLDYSIRATVTADEDDQKRWSRYVKLFDNDFKYFENPLLKNLLEIPFDAVLTTNYTYELENALDDSFPRSDHKEDFACTTAKFGFPENGKINTARLLNTFNRIKGVDIWHIHGEVRDPASMILTHEEYGRLVTELVHEEQNENNEGLIAFDSWQDYLVYGDLYILGQGVNFAEFDLWWMLSRRRREKTGMGRTIYYAPQQTNKKYTGVEEALDQIGVKVDNCGTTLPDLDSTPQDEINQVFRDFYNKASERIKKRILNPLPLDTELLIEYRERTAINDTKTNKLRLMYQLAKTKVYVIGYIDKEYDMFIPYEYGFEGTDPFIIQFFSTKDAYPDPLEEGEVLQEMTGLEVLELAEIMETVQVLVLDPYSAYGDVWLPMAQAVYMKKDPEELKKYVEEADEKDLARRKNNVNRASEANHYISSFISNCTFDNTLDEVWSDIDNEGYFNCEMMLNEEEVQWTSPKNSEPGDIVFFSLAQNVKSKITKLKTELKSIKGSISEERYKQTEDQLDRAIKNYDIYGRKIFAIGQIVEKTEEIDPDDPFYMDPSTYHFNAKYFSCITNIFELKHPVSMDDYKDFISISKFGSITPVHGENFSRLQKLILDKNADMGDEIPYYFRKSTAMPNKLSDLNDSNWMSLDSDMRLNFTSKNKYQSYYTDYLLKAIGDTKKYGLSCRFRKPNMADAFMDNAISFEKRWLPVKIFVGVSDDEKALDALEKYCHASEIIVSKDKIVSSSSIYSDKVLVIDKKRVSVYDSPTHEIIPVQLLDELKSSDDVALLKDKLASVLGISNNKDDLSMNTAVQKAFLYPETSTGFIEPVVEPDERISSETTFQNGTEEMADRNNALPADFYQGILYIPADDPTLSLGWQEYILPANKAIIANQAALIVESEAVIEKEKLIEKLRLSFGVRNSNEQVIEATEKAIKAAKIKTTKVKGITYCWAADIDPKNYTGFRYHGDFKRKDEELPLPEIRNAIIRTLMDNGPLSEDDLLVKTARTFGYQRLGPNLRNRLSEGIDFAVSDKKIRLNKQKKYELREL